MTVCIGVSFVTMCERGCVATRTRCFLVQGVLRSHILFIAGAIIPFSLST